MGFGAAVATGFRHYAVFSGRASRSEYWWWGLFVTLITLAASIVAAVLDWMSGSGLAGHVIRGLLNLALLLPNCAIAVRRLHDTNRSGWWFGAAAIGAVVMALLAIPMVIRIAENHASGAALLSGLPMSAFAVLAALGVIEASYFIVQFIWFCSHGTRGANRFGADPLSRA